MSFTPKRVLVTGGSGFIGAHFVDHLVRRGIDVTSLDLVQPYRKIAGVDWVQGDVRNPRAVREALERCDAVAHLAAAHHDSGIDAETYFDVNVNGTKVVLEEMNKKGIHEICFFSSVATFGPSADRQDDSSPLRPISPYGQSKLAAEKVILDDPRFSAFATIVRPAVTFGPENFANVYALIRQIDRRGYVQVGPGTNVKSLAYVHNLISFALWAWLERRLSGRPYIWCEPTALTSAEIAKLIARRLGKPLLPIRLPLGFALVLAEVFDRASRALGITQPITKARVEKMVHDVTYFWPQDALDSGFIPSIHIYPALDETVEWYANIGRSMPRRIHIPPRQVVDTVSVNRE